MSDRSLNADRLQDLLESISEGRCVLFLGPEAALSSSGAPVDAELGSLIREKFVRDPPQNCRLSHLCQLVDINDARATVMRHLRKLQSDKVVSPIHAKCAQLPFSLIIQTTPDPLMINALAQIKRPQKDAYDFRADQALPDLNSIGTEREPLVYGLRGLWTVPRSVPLSADEEACHLVALLREQPPLPKSLSAALRDNGKGQRSALFVGFEFAAWQTRFLLHALFATAPTTVIKPSPAVATPYLRPPPPSEEDMEFLWANYHIVFASQPPADFAAELLSEWKNLMGRAPAPTPSREPNLSSLVKFIVTYAEEELFVDFALNFPEFAREWFNAWNVKPKGAKARDLVLWLNERHELEALVEWLRGTYPDAFQAEEGGLFKS